MELANKIQDAFDNVKADAALRHSTMQYLAQMRRKKRPSFFPLSVPGTLAVVCTIALLAIGIGGNFWLLEPVSYVSIDINPSMELALNRFDRVISVTAYNPQGDELIKDLPLKWKKYIQAIHMITESRGLQSYLSSDEELVLTVAADSSRTELKSGVEQCCSHIGHGSRSVSVDVEVASNAHDNGLSVGKYSAYLQLLQYDESVTVDDCKNMSMAQIHNQIIEHEHGSSSGAGHGHSAAADTEATGDAHHTGETDDAASGQVSGQSTQAETTEADGYGHRRRQRHHGAHE